MFDKDGEFALVIASSKNRYCITGSRVIGIVNRDVLKAGMDTMCLG